MKNSKGFSLLEVIISISLAGIVLAVFSRTIKTGLDVQTFLENKNSAVNFAESVLETLKKEDIDLQNYTGENKLSAVKGVKILEEAGLKKEIDAAALKITPYSKDGEVYRGLFKLKLTVDYKCRDKERQYELITLLRNKGS
ncbi:MAG: type IV pilus modification PilV family protein [Bacillota bacterium]